MQESLNPRIKKAVVIFVSTTTLIAFILFLFASSLTSKKEVYQSLPGQDFGPLWIERAFIVDYGFELDEKDFFYQQFEDYLIEIGGIEKITEDSLIKFVANDLKFFNTNYRDVFEQNGRLQPSQFTLFVKRSLYYTYTNPFFNDYTEFDLIRFMSKVYFEIYPNELKNFFKKDTFDGYMMLYDALFSSYDIYDFENIFDLPTTIQTRP